MGAAADGLGGLLREGALRRSFGDWPELVSSPGVCTSMRFESEAEATTWWDVVGEKPLSADKLTEQGVARVEIGFGLIFVSGVFGSGWEWAHRTGGSDHHAVRVLRALQAARGLSPWEDAVWSNDTPSPSSAWLSRRVMLSADNHEPQYMDIYEGEWRLLEACAQHLGARGLGGAFHLDFLFDTDADLVGWFGDATGSRRRSVLCWARLIAGAELLFASNAPGVEGGIEALVGFSDVHMIDLLRSLQSRARKQLPAFPSRLT